MGIFSAMTTAVSGLRAQSYALENISGNIANAQTVGFKRSDTAFADMVSDDGAAPTQRSGTVRASTQSTNSVAGGIMSSETATNMSISGAGYFILAKKTGQTANGPIFSSESLYTRRGDFMVDRDGYLVNGAGYYLKAIPVDLATGEPASSTPQPIQFSNDLLPAKGTTTITYRVNLPSFPKTTNADANVPGSELLPAALLTPAGGGLPEGIQADDEASFLENSITGGSVPVYDANGNQVNMQMRWAKVSGTPGTPSQWKLFYRSDSTATGTDLAWTTAGDFAFDAQGKLTSPTGGSTTLNAVNINGMALGNLDLNFGSGLTQYGDLNGSMQVNSVGQDGYAAGQVVGVSVSDGGSIVASYSNGKTLELGRVVLATFNGQDSLKKVDGSAFQETLESGPAIIGGATGEVQGSSLEASNTDIAQEFSKLIVTQQAYSANTRIISTTDQMMQEVMNMKR